MRMLWVCVQTYRHRDTPLSHVLTHTDKYMCLVSIYADELKHTYFYLTEQHAP